MRSDSDAPELLWPEEHALASITVLSTQEVPGKQQASRHLIHYNDDLVDGTCSMHCAAVAISLNLVRGPKAIYAADNGSSESGQAVQSIPDA